MLKGLLTFQGPYRILHLTWFAFFLSCVCVFNFAPFASIIGKDLNLDEAQIKTILTCNLAITIPARIIIGGILDRYGPRRCYSILLILTFIPCLATALAQDFTQMVMARLMMGIVGASFVLGIRMVSEWFPPKEIGMAQGIYGGWGNAGSFGSGFALPLIAASTAFLAGGGSNWRLTMVLTGAISAIYGVIYFNNVTDTPPGKEYQRPKQYGGIEVTSAKDFYGLLVMNSGLFFALGLLGWQLSQKKFHFLSSEQTYFIWFLLGCLYAYQSYQAWLINREVVLGKKQFPPAERYQFSQVALLELTYITNYGAELATVSMLPLFFERTFGLSQPIAATISAIAPLLNLVARPTGGLMSDKLGSRKWMMTLVSLGIGISYLIAYRIDNTWSLPLAIAIVMLVAIFFQAGSGSTCAMMPLIKKEITGQIAGNVGAYANVGAVIFLTIFSLTDAQTTFAAIGISGLICTVLCAFFLKEPRNSFGADSELESNRQLQHQLLEPLIDEQHHDELAPHLELGLLEPGPPQIDRGLIVSATFFPYIADRPDCYRTLQNQIARTYLEIERHQIIRHKITATTLKKPKGIMRIGYLASTLRSHSVGWMSRWLWQYHDRDRFQIFTYCINQNPDDPTYQKWFRDRSDVAYCFGNDANEIAAQIQADKIDILIDLDSLTLDTTCQILAAKPAPIQVSWLGWDATGLPTVDYFIADRYVLPANAQEYYQEQIWRLPKSYVAVDGFEVGTPTIRREDLNIAHNAIVYWSGQRGDKRHPQTIKLQMEILKSVPDSYLLIKGESTGDIAEDLFRNIAIEIGVNPDRLRFLPMETDEVSDRANLTIADVVLDTFPYNGTINTLETLWMGIPIVTQVGQQFAARNSYTLMLNAGIDKGIAWNEQEYVDWGVKFGLDRKLRLQVRERLRLGRKTAPVWNARQFTIDMEQAYQQMWTKHLETV
jgi:MFS transporter, NNP family, nitrate/nitrite transporter